jgi:hypothetical protein
VLASKKAPRAADEREEAAMISERDVAFYREHGDVVVVPYVLEPAIYENQSDAARRHFAIATEAEPAPRT